jgi:ABC-type amino acid transport substrate-binding protein
MMKLALSHSTKKFRFEETPDNFTQKRSEEEVLSKRIDIMWAASNQELEDELLPVRIPLYKGLLGHRIFLIRSGDQERFNGVKNIDDLRKIPIGQGRGWADTAILQANGLKVIAPTKFESLMYMLEGGRFDAFPRGVFEPFAEVAKYAKLNLTVEKNIMLVYKMPYYLFVSPTDKELANELETGLNRAIADGSFEKLFRSSPNVQEAIAKADMKNRVIFQLDNPNLPKGTPIDRSELWVDPKTL